MQETFSSVTLSGSAAKGTVHLCLEQSLPDTFISLLWVLIWPNPVCGLHRLSTLTPLPAQQPSLARCGMHPVLMGKGVWTCRIPDQ